MEWLFLLWVLIGAGLGTVVAFRRWQSDKARRGR